MDTVPLAEHLALSNEATTHLLELRLARAEIERLKNVIKDYLDWSDPVICTAPDLKIIRDQMRSLVEKT